MHMHMYHRHHHHSAPPLSTPSPQSQASASQPPGGQRAPMNKANNRFAFYMLMFCSVGTLGNLVLLNVVRFGALAPSCLAPHTSCGSPRLHSARSCACAAPIDLHGMSYERSEGSKKY